MMIIPKLSARGPWSLVLWTMALVLLLVSCTGNDTGDDPPIDAGQPGSEQSEGDNPADGQEARTLTVALSDFGNDTLDPAMDSRVIVLNQHLQMWDTLFEIGPDGELEPGVVETWEVDDTGLMWTFHIREGIMFHDGWGELTADDVVFSLNRFQNERSESTYGTTLAETIESVEAVDDYTVELTTSNVSVNLLQNLQAYTAQEGIVFPSEYLLEEGGSDFESQSALLEEHPIGSGPYQFASRERGSEIRYTAVEDHWRVTPQFDELIILRIPEPSTQLAMLQSDEVDLISVEGDEIDQVEAAGMDVQSIPAVTGIIVQFLRTHHPEAEGMSTTDPEVRRALSLAIDRQAIIDSIVGGRAQPVEVPAMLAPTSIGVDPAHFEEWAEEVNRYDPEEAREILADAGYSDGVSDFRLYAFDRAGATFLPSIAEIVAAQWAEVGVEAELTNIDYAQFREGFIRPDPANPDLVGDSSTHAAALWNDPLTVLSTFYEFDPGVAQLLNEPDLDQDIAAAGSVIDDDERQQLVHDMFDRVNDTWVVVPLFNLDGVYGSNPETVGELQGIPGYQFLGRVFENISTP